MPLSARSFAPVNSCTATGRTANTSSWVSRPCTSWRLFARPSSRLESSFSLRPYTPPLELMYLKYALTPSYAVSRFAPVGSLDCVTTPPTLISLAVTPGWSTAGDSAAPAPGATSATASTAAAATVHARPTRIGDRDIWTPLTSPSGPGRIGLPSEQLALEYLTPVSQR